MDFSFPICICFLLPNEKIADLRVSLREIICGHLSVNLLRPMRTNVIAETFRLHVVFFFQKWHVTKETSLFFSTPTQYEFDRWFSYVDSPATLNRALTVRVCTWRTFVRHKHEAKVFLFVPFLAWIEKPGSTRTVRERPTGVTRPGSLCWSSRDLWFRWELFTQKFKFYPPPTEATFNAYSC